VEFYMKNYFVRYLFIFLIFNLSVTAALAFEEEHEAHEHGHATLMLVQEKNELQLVFKSPAMNIIGFEHQASSPEQHAKIEWAKQSLSDATSLFMISQNAQCVLEHVDIKSSLLEADDHSDEHKSHHEDEHNDEHESHHEDEHSDEHASHHEDEHSDEHASHHEDEHSDHADDITSHSEFEAEYHFECASISQLKEINVALFKTFTSLEEIEARIITNAGQALRELDRNSASIKF
jgi:hypothetical protein